MIIDVRKLKFSGKQTEDFSFDFNPKEELSLIPNAVTNLPISVSGSLELHNDDVFVDGNVSCTIVGKCDRCLDDAVYNFSQDFSVTYVLSNPNEDDDEYLYKSGVVDLTKAVTDVILTNFPSVIYCKSDCKGLCPVCGANLNKQKCNCK